MAYEITDVRLGDKVQLRRHADGKNEVGTLRVEEIDGPVLRGSQVNSLPDDLPLEFDLQQGWDIESIGRLDGW